MRRFVILAAAVLICASAAGCELGELCELAAGNLIDNLERVQGVFG